MHRKRIISTLAIAAFAGATLGGGTVSAATSRTPAAAAPAARGTTTLPASDGTVRITAYANDDLPGATVILSGAIGDFGEGASVLPNGAIDPEHSSEFNLALTQGSFRINIGPLHEKLLAAFAHFNPNPRTCSGYVAVTAAAPIVAGSGTGAYKGISGNFKLTATVNEVNATPNCRGGRSVLFAQDLIIAGAGTVSFG